jgi:hypothetical protein
MFAAGARFITHASRFPRPGSLALASLAPHRLTRDRGSPVAAGPSGRRPHRVDCACRHAGAACTTGIAVITELEFKSLAAQGYNRIPLIAEAFADLETPLSLYLKLAGGARHSFLLESVVGGERFGRYSFIGLPARTLLRASGFVTEVVTDGGGGDARRQPAGLHRRLPAALQGGAAPRPAALLRRPGGLLRLRRGALHRAQAGQDLEGGGIDTPDILLLQTEELAVIDNLSGRLYLIVYADPGQPESYFNGKAAPVELADKLRYSVTAPPVKRGPATRWSASSTRPTTWPPWRAARSTSPPAT